MFRLRLAALAVVAFGFGSVCGCCSLSFRPHLGRHSPCADTGCCDIGAVPDGEVPLGGGCCPAPVPPINPGLLVPPNLPPQNTVPPLAPPPQGDRIVPIPRSPTAPYVPQQYP